MRKYILFLVLLLGMGRGQAQLDPSFGSNGFVREDFFPNINVHHEMGGKVLLRSDGKMYVLVQANNQTLISRRLANGAVDATYGDNGFSVAAGVSGLSAALQADGKVVVGGQRLNPANGLTSFALVRYNADGSLDVGFGANGIVTTSIGAGEAYLFAIALQSNGKIVAVGSSGSFATGADFALARYNTDGSLDNTFDGDGIATTDFATTVNNTTQEEAHAVTVQSDGKLVVGGYIDDGSGTGNYDFALARYNTDGSLDNTFSGDGKVSTNFAGFGDLAQSVAIQTDGKVVVAGYAYNNVFSDADFALARYNTDGTLDTDSDSDPGTHFGGDGKVTTAFSAVGDYALEVVIQSDGKIVAGGYTELNSADFALARYNTDGSPDNGFDGDGKVTTDFGPSQSDVARSLAIQGSDGRIVAVGYNQTFTGDFRTDFALARYNTDGTLDAGFDGDGLVVDYIRQGQTVFTATAVQSDGKVVVAGYARVDASNNGGFDNYDFVVVRYNPDGSPDNTFAGDGMVVTAFGSTEDVALDLVLQGDGKIVVVGYSRSASNRDFALARYNTDGSLDNTFDGDGKVTTPIGASDDFGSAVALQADGKIVVAGYMYNGNNNDFALARYNTDGSLDTDFDGDGKQTTPVSTTGIMYDFGEDVLLQSDGKIVVAGFSNKGTASVSDNDIALVRYNADGSLDNSFDGDGKLTTAVGSGDDFGASVVQQTDSKLVVAGYTVSGNVYDFALVRYNDSDGSLDNTFDGDGKLTTDFNTPFDVATSVALQGDGKIVAGGSAGSALALARYNSDGSLDTDFSSDGKATVLVGASIISSITAIDLSEEKLYAAGYMQRIGQEGIAAVFTLDCELVTFYADADGDGYGDPGNATEACGAPEDYVTDNTDCNDTDETINPGAAEVCDGVDNDCDNQIDEGLATTTFYEDSDGDGYGNPGSSTEACSMPTGFVADNTDCDDSDIDIHPGATEVCDQQDNDCNGQIDEAVQTTFYEDSDGDGYGKTGVTTLACSQPEGYAAQGGDCNDTDETINPGAAEVCTNSIDDDCDGQANEGCPGNPAITINDVTVYESQGTATLTVSLSKAGTLPVRVDYKTVKGTASAPKDFVAVNNGRLTIPAGVQTGTINITIVQDNRSEGTEFFNVQLGKPVNATISDGLGQVTILNGTAPAAANEVITRASQKQIQLTVQAMPNPAAHYFMLHTRTLGREPLTVQVWDVLGRLVEVKTGIVANGSFTLGHNYQSGTYYAEVVQGKERATLTLVKLAY